MPTPAAAVRDESRGEPDEARETLRVALGTTRLGAVIVVSGPAGIAAILLGDDRDALLNAAHARFPAARLVPDDDAATLAAATAAVEGRDDAPELALDLRGTPFQRRVWAALLAIPSGETASYADVARRIGAPTAVRAVAGACAANRHAVVIPCHRVLRGDGALSGYAWGVERKRALLVAEGAISHAERASGPGDASSPA